MARAEPAPTADIPCLLQRVLLALTGLNLLWWLLGAWPRALGYPFGFDFGEGILWNQVRMIALGQSIYGPITDYPYLVSNYPPLYMGLVSLFAQVMSETTPLFVGRLVTGLGSLAIVGGLILLWSRAPKASIGHALPWIAPLWLVSAPVWRWSQVMRVDTLGIAFALWGLLIVTCTKTKLRWLAPLLFLAAILTKHSFVSAPAVWLLASLLWENAARKREALVGWVGIVAGLVITTVITGGGLLAHTVTYTANEFSLVRLLAGLSEFFALTLPLWALIGVAWATYTRSEEADAAARIWGLYLLLSTATLVTFGATGSDSNYYLEPMAALLALSLVLFTQVFTPAPRGWPLKPAFAAGLCGLIFLGIARWGAAAEFPLLIDWRANRAGAEMLTGLLAAAPGAVLSEDFTYTLAAGKSPDFQPYIFRLLAENGKWDEAPFVADLAAGRYDILLLQANLFQPGNQEEAGQDAMGAGFDRLTPSMEEAIRHGYRLRDPGSIFANGTWYVYVRQ